MELSDSENIKKNWKFNELKTYKNDDDGEGKQKELCMCTINEYWILNM